MKISTFTLLRVYRQHGISRKGFRFVKTLSIKDPGGRVGAIRDLKKRVQQAREAGRRLIFTDEAVFTTATLASKGYAHKGENVTIEEKLTSSPALAVVAGVSEVGGLEAFDI